MGLEHVSGPLERLVTRLTVSLPELGHQIRCGHCGTVGLIDLPRHPANDGAGMRCAACDEDHPLAPRASRPGHDVLTVAQVAAMFAEARAQMLTDGPQEDARNAS